MPLKIPGGLCVLYIPVPNMVSLSKHDTQFSRMKAKTNILSPRVTPVGSEHFLVILESYRIPELVVTFEFFSPAVF